MIREPPRHAVFEPFKTFGLNHGELWAFFVVDFFIQFNVPFKIIFLIWRQANWKVGRNGSTPRKNT